MQQEFISVTRVISVKLTTLCIYAVNNYLQTGTATPMEDS